MCLQKRQIIHDRSKGVAHIKKNVNQKHKTEEVVQQKGIKKEGIKRNNDTRF